MHINLDQDWRNWAQENLAKSCHPTALFDVMRTNGFSAKDIRDVLGDAYPVELDGGYLPSPVDYQALARIPERGGMHPGLSCFSKEPCQLYTIENFLSPDECLELIRRSEGQLTPSKTTYSNGDGAFRTSMTCHLNRHTDPF